MISRRMFCGAIGGFTLALPSRALSVDPLTFIAYQTGSIAINYGPEILDFIANTLQLVDNTSQLSLNEAQSNASRLGKIEDAIDRIEPQIRDIRKDLISIGVKLDQLQQDSLYISAYSLQARVASFNILLLDTKNQSLTEKEKEELNSEFNHLRFDLEELITRAVPTIEISSTSSRNMPLTLVCIANSAKGLFATAPQFYSDQILRARKAKISSFIADLHNRCSQLVVNDGIYDLKVSKASKAYKTEIDRIASERKEFREFIEFSQNFCIETWNATAQRINPVDKFFPLDHYQRRDRETGALRPKVYTSGYVHLRLYDAHPEASYIEVDGFKIHTGISKVILSQPTIKGSLTNGCEVPLEKRDVPQWLEQARVQYNSRLEAIEPYAKNLVFALSERAVAKSAVNSLYETKTHI